jgi:hypothetical protein
MIFKAKIYIAGPYTNGDVAENVYKAIKAANEIAELGYAPYIPHLTHFWHMMFKRSYKFWLELDNQFLYCCDGILRIPGKSNGADNEIDFAQKIKKPVFYSIKEMENYYDN